VLRDDIQIKDVSREKKEIRANEEKTARDEEKKREKKNF
jgi:hypothetical protein